MGEAAGVVRGVVVEEDVKHLPAEGVVDGVATGRGDEDVEQRGGERGACLGRRARRRTSAARGRRRRRERPGGRELGRELLEREVVGPRREPLHDGRREDAGGFEDAPVVGKEEGGKERLARVERVELLGKAPSAEEPCQDVVLLDPRDVPDLRLWAQPVNIDLLLVRRLFEVMCIAQRFLP